MSYRDHAERLETMIEAAANAETFRDAYDLEEIVWVHRAITTERFAETRLSEAYELLQEFSERFAVVAREAEAETGETPELLVEALAALDGMSAEQTRPAPEGAEWETVGELMDQDEWGGVLAAAERELHALPGSAAAGIVVAAALIQLERLEEARERALEVAETWPSRHPMVLAASAAFLQGDKEEGFRCGLSSMGWRRQSVNLPETWRNPGRLAMVEDDEARIIEDATRSGVHALIKHFTETGTPQRDIQLQAGVILHAYGRNKSKKDSYKALLAVREDVDTLSDLERAAFYTGLASGERWLTRFDDAAECLDKLGEDAPDFVDDERALLERDRRLMAAAHLRLEGHGQVFELFRTRRTIGDVWYSGEQSMRGEKDLADQSEEALADMLRDRASAWIACGFDVEVLSEEPLESSFDEDDEDEDDPSFDEPPMDEELRNERAERGLALLEAAEFEALLDWADEALTEQPFDGVLLAARTLALVANGRHREAAESGRRAVELLSRRPVAGPLAMAEAGRDYGVSCELMTRALRWPHRSETPEAKFSVAGLHLVTEQEGALLDAVENVVYQSVPESHLLLEALVTPSRKFAREKLVERFDDMSEQDQGWACLAIGIIDRLQNDADQSRSWLDKAEAAGLEGEVARERELLQQDLEWVELGREPEGARVQMTMGDLTFAVYREFDLMRREFRLGDRMSMSTYQYTGSEDRIGATFKDVVRQYLGLGFELETLE